MPTKEIVLVRDLDPKKVNRLLAKLDPSIRKSVQQLLANEKKAASKRAAVEVLGKEFVAWFEDHDNVVTSDQLDSWHRINIVRRNATKLRHIVQRVHWLNLEQVYVLLPDADKQARRIYKRRQRLKQQRKRLKLVS